jgi:asparagine synthase (glutamine-hydrolysing)
MCGIAGFVLQEGEAEAARVRAMCDVIRHRGPDDEGIHVDGRCGIGMRRLSILDLSTGHQPMGNEDGSVWVVFNGEIYNYRDLRRELTARGHRFATNSDTETLVHLYEEDGEAGLSRLRGMFGYAIWDGRRQRLFLARDRFGKKPLYYAEVPPGSTAPAGLYFGSELKCLRAAGVPLEIDPEALRLYFQFTYIPDPRSPFRQVKKLEAGTWLSYDRKGGSRKGRYWRMPGPREKSGPDFSIDDSRRRLREVFDEAVRLRMIADVPLGAFLSGGIDSSCVVASMATQSTEPVKTFSIGFEESEFNELEYASLVARRYKTEHHEILVRPDSVNLVTRLVRHFDEPFGDSSAIPTYVVSEFAARHVKVALSGDGGDELFAGYARYLAIRKLKAMDRVPGAVRRAISWLADRLPYSAYGKNFLRMIGRPNALERYFDNNYTPYFLRRELLEPEWMLPADAAFLRRTFAEYLLPGGADILSQALQFETTANLTGDMLVKVDRMSMANSLEVRCPLLDHHLAELAASIPHEWKLRNGRGKYVLVDALRDYLPAELLNRGKMGFGVPLSLWFRGSLREFLWDHLTGKRFLGRGIVSAPFLRTLLEEHQSGRRDNYLWLWSLLMLELWFRDFEEPLAV